MRLSLCVIACVTLACAAPGEIQPSLNQPFSLRVGQTAGFPDAQLRITFRAVSEDSRCPRVVTCVWRGNGQVQLDVRVGGSLQTLVLNTTTEPRQAPVRSHRLQLDALAPEPEASHPIPPGDYVATFTLQAGPA